MKGIFDTRPGSGYDDEVQSRYHFPDRYLAEARKTVGDWIVYRTTRRGGGGIGYFAAAQVAGIDPDPARAGHSYARVRNYLPFDDLVPLERAQGFYERQLDLLPKKSLVGRTLQGRSVRTISDLEFGDIVRSGLRETLAPANAIRFELDNTHVDAETRALVDAPEEQQERRIVQIL